MKNKIEIAEDWWKWGAATNRKKLAEYPKLKQFLEGKLQTNLDDVQSAPTFELETEEESSVVKNFKKELPHIIIQTDIAQKLLKSIGKSYHDLLFAFHHEKLDIPQAVVCPKDQEELQQIISWADKNKTILVPFGGGSNVVGAFLLKDGMTGRFVLDLSKLNRVVEINEEAFTATFEGGMYGPELEKLLNDRGFTMGHFPQSFEFSTIGGWAATRSAGQESSHYGKIDDIVISLKVMTPAGIVNTSMYEGDAEGINLKSLFIGSEGILGVITEVKVKIHRKPKTKKWLTAIFPTFEDGANVLKQLAQNEYSPSVVRYSDEEETAFMIMYTITKPSLITDTLEYGAKAFLNLKGMSKPNILMIRFDGEKPDVDIKVKFATKLVKNHKGFMTGEGLGKKWEESRYGLPYMRDDMLERGLVVDTMETVLPWNKIEPMKRELKARLENSEAYGGEKGVLLAHLSHIYASASSIYFTVITKMDREQAFEQWTEIKNIVTDTIVEFGGAVSHHHSVGHDHQKWYLQKTDEVTIKILKAVKNTLDPNGILNPGKLFDE
ncbi:MAG: FAD-binding oxidoreductase [Chitinophagales bacterium]|nr:FAD-binding oxidoreductase [Chitinophagales bacterium]